MDEGIVRAAEEIRSMRVRGAAKIGRYAAQALGRLAWDGSDAQLDAAAAALVAARPSAVSLPNAVAFVVREAKRGPRPGSLAASAAEFERRATTALAQIGRHGAPLVEEARTVMTICNSQGALTPLFEAKRAGRRFSVIALETRPWRQGLLTVAQLAKEGVDASLAVDSAAWSLLPECALVLTGADSIARNGDVINKVGTGALAVLARERGVPVYVCAETFKLHPKAATGADVPIEEREVAEVVAKGEIPDAVRVRNPVFDVTSHDLIRGYVTELGVLSRDELLQRARELWGW
ncbi:MAG TPA: S-methyl-5-thioribose-1-phosphate isomerase [Candidatus Thermoplasmatota archaeon]|nr:S-methyl-5-thioribose-1-phosphate isomerase [Candidatus Thermoplasmatota archaeon]